MTDIVDKNTRSRMMAAVRKANTRPEMILRRTLHSLGIRGYRIHRKDIPGSPDLAWISRRVAVFVDGSFWHGHPSAYTPGKSGEFWDRKISQNIERDRRVDASLREAGWTVLRLWDFDVKRNPIACAERVTQTLRIGSANEPASVVSF